MFGNYKKYWLFWLAIFFFICVVLLFYFDRQVSRHHFTFAMIDVGQGDALFVESPSGAQILIDGGPKGEILKNFPQLMPFFDRTLDAIVVTNPDTDHIAGFLDVLKKYKVNYFFETGTWNPSGTYRDLKEEVARKNIPVILLKKGMKLDLGAGAKIDVLFPDRDVFDWSPNDGSLVARLSYGSFSAMLTGDATTYTENLILEKKDGQSLKSDILKVGHHGSRTSTGEKFLEAVSPKYAFISSGKDNKYGHPHREILDILGKYRVQVFRTDLLGTVILKCDTMEKCRININ